MTFESWLFSAKRAWQDPWVRGIAVLSSLCVLIASAWFSWQIVGLRHAPQGLLVLHYNVYFGIDALRAWGWMFVFPAVWILCTCIDLLWMFGVYREDLYQAWALLFLMIVWSIPWTMLLWHLVRINH